MSDRKRKQITKEMMEKEYVSPEEKKRALATVLYEIRNSYPFMGAVLQSMNIMYTHAIPTAGIMFNTDARRWDMWINPKFFCKNLDNVKNNKGKTAQKRGDYARGAVMLHELSHITNKHPMRVPFLKISSHKRRIMNVAMDMAINQYIKHLPEGCPECPPIESGEPCKNEECCGRAIFVSDFYDEVKQNGNTKKVPWEKGQTAEHYYSKLLERITEPEDDDNGDGDGEGGGSGKGIPQTLDEHMWEGNVEEKDMLDATEELMKRAMIKSRFDYSDLPDSIKELLDHIKSRRAELDYKGMILAAIKRSASGHERKSTWVRPSRRYGNKAPGTTVGDLPKLQFYLDTSGSISTEELNEFLGILDNFLKAGSRKCRMNLFHTANYYSAEYKLGQRLGDKGISSIVESGGTCLEDSLRDIAKRRPDLAIFVTDGYYGDVEVEKWLSPNMKFPQCLFIISKQGSKDHPLKRLGITIQIPSDGSNV